MTVVVDGVIFSLDQPGPAQVWREVLPRLASDLGMRLVLLDRGDTPGGFDGVDVVPFPSYDPGLGAADSILLEQMCRHFDADVFISTWSTTPLETPSVMLVDYSRDRYEQAIAVAHARRFVCVSATAKADLLEGHPELTASSVAVAGPDVELADALTHELRRCAADRAAGRFADFGLRWKELRQIQAAVNVWGPQPPTDP